MPRTDFLLMIYVTLDGNLCQLNLRPLFLRDPLRLVSPTLQLAAELP